MKKQSKKPKQILTTGKRKRAVARATIRKGKGDVRINGKSLDEFPEVVRLRIKEAIMIAGDLANQVNIFVKVKGGGIKGQADAARQAIATALNELSKGKLRESYLKYDRTLLVADSRRTEPHKPSRSKAGPRRHKQRSKR